MQLDNSVALVTGANRGLGRSLVKALGASGVKHIHAGGRRTFQPVPVGSQTSVTPLTLDVSDDAQIDAACTTASDTTLLINNAGVLPRGSVLSTTPQDMRDALDVNLIGMWQMARKFAPVIAQNGGGTIVNVLSLISLQNAPFFAAYSAAKYGAWALTQSLQAEFAGSSINVVACFPGGIDTEMLSGFDVEKANPDSVASDIVKGIARGQSTIFPDPASKRIGPLLMKEG